jgi:hypothetical protein
MTHPVTDAAHRDAKLVNLHADISAHLEAISELFTQRPKITIIIRTPWLKDGGVLLSDDNMDDAIAEIRRLEKRTPVVGASHE